MRYSNGYGYMTTWATTSMGIEVYDYRRSDYLIGLRVPRLRLPCSYKTKLPGDYLVGRYRTTSDTNTYW